MARIARRDEQALSLLYDRYAGTALAVAERVLGDRAAGEDVVQEAFVRVWEDAGRYSEARGSVAAWLVSAVRNRAIDQVRRRGARERATLKASERLSPITEAAVVNQRLAARVKKPATKPGTPPDGGVGAGSPDAEGGRTT